MHSIDFLPNDYRRQAANRRSHVWLLIALVVFGAFMAAVTTHQFLVLRTVRQQYEHVEAPYTQAQLANDRFAKLTSELAEANVQADLHTYLRHPWPRTQVLAALIKHLPPEVSLTEVTMHREERKRNRTPAASSRAAVTKKDEDASKKPDARKTLERLRGEIDSTRTVISVRGVTTDNSALHRCIRALGDLWLFTKADLASLDSMEDDTTPGAASFEMCLELLPGYGQKDGPAKGPAESIASRL